MINLAPEIDLATDRLVLEPLGPEHAKVLYDAVCDERIYRFIPQEPPSSVQALQKLYTDWSSRRSPDKSEAWLNWAMRLQESRTYVGTLQATVRKDRTSLIAYSVFPDHWKQGFAVEGCRRILDHLKIDYCVFTVYADVDTRNLASIRLLERLGFERLALNKNADFFKGNASDEFRYQLAF